MGDKWCLIHRPSKEVASLLRFNTKKQLEKYIDIMIKGSYPITHIYWLIPERSAVKNMMIKFYEQLITEDYDKYIEVLEKK